MPDCEGRPTWLDRLQLMEARIQALESGQLGAKGDYAIEVNERFRSLAQCLNRAADRITELEARAAGSVTRQAELFERVRVLEQRMSEGGLKDGQTLRARVEALELRADLAAAQGGGHERRIEALEAQLKIDTKMLNEQEATHNHLLACAHICDEVRELVLAARAALIRARTRDEGEKADSFVLERALKPFEEIK